MTHRNTLLYIPLVSLRQIWSF